MPRRGRVAAQGDPILSSIFIEWNDNRQSVRDGCGFHINSMSATYRFPAGFLWGAATSSHQVEGDNRANDWWEFEQAGRLPYSSGNACAHFERYESDFDLARSWGHNAHRFSIEWSRVEPAGGKFDPAALDHYASVVASLRKRQIEPVVTLHHFTTPAWFAHRGGWTRPESVEQFARYIGTVM